MMGIQRRTPVELQMKLDQLRNRLSQTLSATDSESWIDSILKDYSPHDDVMGELKGAIAALEWSLGEDRNGNFVAKL